MSINDKLIPCSVISVLTTWLHVQIIQSPVLQLLTEVLDTNLQQHDDDDVRDMIDQEMLPLLEGGACHCDINQEQHQNFLVIDQRSILVSPESRNHKSVPTLQ